MFLAYPQGGKQVIGVQLDAPLMYIVNKAMATCLINEFCFQSVLDYETYIMNLTEANLSDHPKWQKEYTFKVQTTLSHEARSISESLANHHA